MKTALFVLIIMVINVWAAFELSTSNAFSGGILGNFTTGQDFFSSYLTNPASSSYTKDFHLGINYCRPYNLPGLNVAGIFSLIPLKTVGAGVSMVTLGNSLYQEYKITGNVSRTFFHRALSVGLNWNWYQINVRNYNSSHSFGMDAGILCKIIPQLVTGFSIQNISQARLNGYLDEIPLVTSLGFVFQPTQDFSTYLSVSKDAGYPAALQIGLNFVANSSISIQSAFSSYPAVPSIGFRFNHQWISINYMFQYHFELGGTHFWGVSFSKKGLENE